MAPRKPNLNLLKTFQRAAFHQNLTRAADELCISQAAVSRQIGLLEDQLGIKLFQRNNRGIELTDQARPLYEVLTSALNDIDRSLDQFISDSAAARSRLSIGIDPSITDNWLRHRFSGFRQAHPTIQIELHPQNSYAPDKHHQIQIIYGSGAWEGYLSELLYEPVDFAVCSPELIAPATALTGLEELSEYPLIHEFSIQVWQQWLRNVKGPEIDARSGAIVHNSLMCLDMAANGEGIILSDDIVAADYLFSGRLIKPLAEGVDAQDKIYLIYPPEQSENQDVQAFSAWIKAEFDAHLNQAQPLRSPQPFSL